MSILFSYQESSLVAQQNIDFLLKFLEPEIARMASMKNSYYSESSGFINLPFDEEYQSRINACAEEKKALNPKLILLIGIGGSNLGCLAIHEALFGKFYNEKNHANVFYCADTLDGDKLRDLIFIVESHLIRNNSVMFVIVTKSGTTHETMINAAFFIDLLKKYRPLDYQLFCIAITDKGSPFECYAQKLGMAVIEIPSKVGGRFSVFSAAALVPLALMGVDIRALCCGAKKATQDSVSVGYQNYAALSAVLIFYYYQKKMYVHDTFFFDAAHESLGKWYRQLMAESLGKRFDCHGNFLEAGILPTVSVGTVDLHSMVQLYLGGPKIRFTTFIPAEQNNKALMTNFLSIPTALETVQEAIFKGVQQTYLDNKLPFITFSGIGKNAESLGAFLQYKMFEIVYLGFLMNVNQFDQPQVEIYKKEVLKKLHV